MIEQYLKSLFSLEFKVAVVTGASRGIGNAIADALYKAGAIVYGMGRSARAEVNAKWNYIECDVTSLENSRSVFEQVNRVEGGIHILVNSAGITEPGQGKDQVEVFNRTIKTNLLAAYTCCVGVLPHMKPHKNGSIINVTSIGSDLGFPGNPGYVASKGGLRLLTKALATDLAVDNIRVNNLAPGYIKTEMTRASFSDSVLNEERRQRTLLGRWGEVSDLCGAAIFLASDASSYVTGADLFIDGGWTAKGL